MFRKNWKNITLLAAFMLLFTVNCISTGMANVEWNLPEPSSLIANTQTTITLEQKVTDSSQLTTSGTLWFHSDSPDLIYPETVPYQLIIPNNSSSVQIPIFSRGPVSADLTIYDSATKTSSSCLIKTQLPSSKTTSGWIPRLNLTGEENLPVAFANQPATATLTLVNGSGSMPPSTQIIARDHRGRMVYSRIFSTFNLTGGMETVKIGTPGIYDIEAILVNDDATSLPQAQKPESVGIPFGKTEIQGGEPSALPDGVTTASVLAMRVAFENLPTTATIVGRDRTQLTILGVPSREIQKNKWPFVITGSDVIDMSRDEQKAKGARLVQWQRRLGSSFAPVHLKWSDVQKSPGSLNWSKLNSALPLYRQFQVRPLLEIDGRSNWDNKLPGQTTATLDAWVGFIREVADKHMKNIWGLQCWTHPDRVWLDPSQYVEILEGTLNGFQLKNGERIPAAPVIGGNTREFNQKYLSAILNPFTIERLNGISFGFQPKDKMASPEANHLEGTLDQAVQLLVDKKADKLQIWTTGTGWPVGPDGVTPKLQANYMVRAHVMALAHTIYKVYWDNLISKTTVPWEKNPAHRKGLLNPDFVPNISGTAYNIMTYMMSGVAPIETKTQGSARIYSFNIELQSNKWPGKLYVAWTDSPEKVQTIRLDMTQGGGVYALDYLGAEIQATKNSVNSDEPIAGSYSFQVGYEPVYIWDAGKPNR